MNLQTAEMSDNARVPVRSSALTKVALFPDLHDEIPSSTRRVHQSTGGSRISVRIICFESTGIAGYRRGRRPIETNGLGTEVYDWFEVAKTARRRRDRSASMGI